MPSGSDFTHLVRARMDITGEKYNTARRAVLEAARAAVPESADHLSARLRGLAGPDLAAFIARHVPFALRAEHSAIVLESVAGLCEYQAGWRVERFPEGVRNRAAAARLVACARDLRAMPHADIRLSAMGAAWERRSTCTGMQDAEDEAIGSLAFAMTGEQLVDYLARAATRLLLSLDGI